MHAQTDPIALFHKIVRRVKRSIFTTSTTEYRPHIPDHIDKEHLLEDISFFFGLARCEIDAMWQTYRAFHEEKRYAEQLGERKTLSFEEAFILYVILSLFRPQTIIEIGTQYGRSTRRIIDMKHLLDIDGPVSCFDIRDEVEHFTRDEAELFLKDVTWTFREDILNVHKSGIIFLDARPYHLVRNVIEGVLENSNWILAIHDCSRGLCNPRMKLSKDDPNITSRTGSWERHVLAEVFGIEDVMSNRLDNLETVTHRLKVFDTPHGLAVILPRALLRPRDRLR